MVLTDPQSTAEVAASPKRASRVSPESLTSRAYERLEELIVTLELAPGTTVSEIVLAERLGVSRTPVREALQRLAGEGLVRVMPRRGLLITDLDVGKQLRMLELRREVDRLLARCAAARRTDAEADDFNAIAEIFARCGEDGDGAAFTGADRQFNTLLYVASGNEFAARTSLMTQGHSRRFWFAHHRQHSSVPIASTLHSAIAEAIAAGDPARAADGSDALLDHVEAFTRATLG